ncbi:uncharacterized protein LOC126838817 [Adelges cooleyi]|uniref:uncharacterized protein LOC126838817 n=1 Tax=Adelges cooleyi TaxID=133065 RepID=UPI00217F34C6|nr:uncharacterized protein LOC126838817 [Adelges cooleyi]
MAVASENGSEKSQETKDLMCLNRVTTEIPVVKIGYKFVTHVINGLKDSSFLVQWSLDKVSSSAEQAVKYPLSYGYVKQPLLAVDRILCSTLDLAEHTLPVITKTPEQVYDDSVKYVMGVVTPITEWVDVELMPPAEYYVDYFLPELESGDAKSDDSDKKSKVLRLAKTVVRRTVQHAYAEPKYLVLLTFGACQQSFTMLKLLIVDQKLLLKTFQENWKKLGDGVTAEEAAKSKLLVEMGCIRLTNGASVVVKTVEISAAMAKMYIDMFLEYVRLAKDGVIDTISRIVKPSSKPRKTPPATPPKNKKEDTASQPSESSGQPTSKPNESTSESSDQSTSQPSQSTNESSDQSTSQPSQSTNESSDQSTSQPSQSTSESSGQSTSQ